MKKFKIAIILASCSLIMSHSLASDRVVAKYNGKEILKSQIETSLRVVLNGMLPDNKKDFDDLDKNLKDRIITEYVNQEILLDKANHSDIQKSDLYKNQLHMLQDQVAIRLFLDRYARRQLTEAAIKSEYNNYVKSLKDNDEIKISHILVQEENVSKDLYNKIKSGKLTFEQAARENSLDGSKSKGGDLGYMPKGATVPEFEEKAYSMKKGEISEPVKTQFGWHLIKVTDIRKRTIPSFEEVKANIEQSALMKIQQKYVAEIVKNSKVEIL